MNKYILSLFWVVLTGFLHPAGAQIDTAWVRVWDSDGYGQNIAVDGSGNVYVSGSSRLERGSITAAYDTDGQILWTRYLGDPDSYGGRPIGMHLNIRGDITLLAMFGSYCTVRYNALGDSIWSRIYMGPMGEYATPAAIVSDDSGNVYVTGWGLDTRCWATLKYDREGTLTWERIFDGYPDYYPLHAYDVGLDGQGNVIVAGLTQMRGSGFAVGITAAKYNGAGDLLWVSRQDSSDVFNRLLMVIDNDDNIYISGQWNWGDSLTFRRRPLLIKFLPDGNKAWTRIYGDTLLRSTDSPVLAANSSGGVCVCGTEKLGPDSLGYHRYKYEVTRFTPDGDVAWARCFDIPEYYGDYPVDIEVGLSGAIYVGGYSWRPIMNPDMTIIKCSPNGDLIWSTTFVGDTLSPEYINDMALDRSENIYITGKVFVPEVGESMVTIKFVQTQTGAVVDPAPFPGAITLSAHPNPFNSATTISYSLPAPGPVSLDIYDILGRKMATLFTGIQPTGEHRVAWDAKGMSSGLYFARLTAGGTTQTMKLLLVK